MSAKENAESSNPKIIKDKGHALSFSTRMEAENFLNEFEVDTGASSLFVKQDVLGEDLVFYPMVKAGYRSYYFRSDGESAESSQA